MPIHVYDIQIWLISQGSLVVMKINLYIWFMPRYG